MPGNPNPQDSNFRPAMPEQNTSGTAGEFTQIFAAAEPSQSSTAAGGHSPFAPADDDFAKLFLNPVSSPTAPSKPEQQDTLSEATLIFEALPAMSQTSSPAALHEQPAMPAQQVRSVAGVSSRPLPLPDSEFTKVFSPVAPPASPVQAVPASARPTTPPSGEFTQFFSAISAREAASQSAPIQVVPEPHVPAPPSAIKSDRSTASGAVRKTYSDPAQGTPFSSEPEPLPPGSSAKHQTDFNKAPPSSANSFTQVFQQGPVASELPRNAMQSAPAPSAASTGESFTQIFQQIPPPSPRRDAADLPYAPVSASPALRVPAASPPASLQEAPAFGPAPQPGGSFTDVFAAQQPQPSSPAAWPAASGMGAPASQGSGFTELFQAMPTASEARAESSPFGSFGAPGVQAARTPAWPAAPLTSQAAPLATAGGDFTRLMESVAADPHGSAAPSTSNDAFFASPPNSSGMAYQESEFTRVQRASSRRESGGTAAPAAVPAAAVAPGLAIAPTKQKADDKEAPSKKSKTLVILLVAMNLLLLLALIIIGFLALRRK